MIRDSKSLSVLYKGETVGRLAMTDERLVAFQYDSSWIKNGFSVSPFSLPLKNSVFIPKSFTFDGLFGVFADSLPDAWGRLVLDRMLVAKGIKSSELDALDRLSIIGKKGRGALEYIPEYNLGAGISDLSIEELSKECEKIFSSEHSENIEKLFDNCGSSGGARPKAYVKLDGLEWIVKFIYSKDNSNFGRLEYEYALCAKRCGIDMAEVRLISTSDGNEYFATKRFDRPKKHMVSAASLLEVDFERSLTDYADLFKLCNIITCGNRDDLARLFKLMCFNVYAENQDDHLKNFAFLYDDVSSCWSLSPAYDLTKCITAFGEHTTLVNGKGKKITDDDLIAVGLKSGLAKDFCKDAMLIIKEECEKLKII